MRRGAKALAALASVFAIIGMFLLSIRYASPFVRSWDEVDFTLAVTRFDLRAMQPHFPGYPYFIVGGMIANQWIADPAKALIVFNAIIALSSAIPIALLARKFVGWPASTAASAIVLTAPYAWMMQARPMSECAGLALLWWTLWAIRQAFDHLRSASWHALSLAMLGFLMGTRMSYFPFGMLLLLLWREKYQLLPNRKGRNVRLLSSVLSAGLFQLVWITGLAMTEGTLSGFWRLSRAFVSGHLTSWGGGVAATPMPFGERFSRLLGDNLLGDALFSRSVWIGAVVVLLTGAIVAGVLRSANNPGAVDDRNRRFMKGLWFCIVFYSLWALLGQNIDKARHIAPVASLLLFIAVVIGLRIASVHDRRSWLSGAIYGLLAALLAAQLAHGAKLLQRQATERPAVYQLNDYVSRLGEDVVLYGWEEIRVLDYLRAPYSHRQVLTYDYFQALASTSPGRVLLTDHVLDGFVRQNPEAIASVKKVAAFESERLFDPAYSDIVLYEWLRQ